MLNYLICSNPSCRLVLDLQGCSEPSHRKEIGLDDCPECGADWADSCPFCAKPINIVWHGHHAHCSYCQRRFYAKAA